MAEETTKRKTKDSVFVKLFGEKKNVYRLYKEFHPEDTDITPEDIKMETLESVMVNTLYQ